MGMTGNDIADGEAKRYTGNPFIVRHILAYACRTARKTKDHE